MSKVITTSPDITLLDLAVKFDISLVPPKITLTNFSEGTGLANCTWWYIIKTPSGTYMHQGSEGTPDVTDDTWATIIVPDIWPQPFQSGQIEYSASNYVVTLYVKDSEDNIFNLVKEFALCRPQGLKATAANNFGKAVAMYLPKCDKAKIYVEDHTNYSYKGNSGTLVSKQILLDYPLDETGTRPDPFELLNSSTASIPISYSGNGYNLFLNTVMEYPFEDRITVVVKYKYTESFPVMCNINLKELMCDYQRLIDEVKGGKCRFGDPNAKEVQDKLLIITSMILRAHTMLSYPDSDTYLELPKLIEEIKAMGQFSCSCFAPGVNISTLGGGGTDLNMSIDGTCGITGTVDKDGNNYVFNIAGKLAAVALSPEMLEAGFTVGATVNGCTTTYTIGLTGSIGGACPYEKNIFLHETSDSPEECPESYFGTEGVDVYDTIDVDIIGRAYNVQDIVNIANSNAAYKALGFVVATSNCTVRWFCSDGGVDIHVAIREAGGPIPCVDNTRSQYQFLIKFSDQVTEINPLVMPGDLYVQYETGGDIFYVGKPANLAQAVVMLAAEPNKPAYVTSYNQDITGNKIFIVLTRANCDFVGIEFPVVFLDRDENIYYGGDSHIEVFSKGRIHGIEFNGPSTLGKICNVVLCGADSENYYWHAMKYGNVMFSVATQVGCIVMHDMTNPRVPVAIGNINLGAPISAPYPPFLGTPQYSGTDASYWDVYFPTDVNYQSNGNTTYVVESSTGVIYKMIGMPTPFAFVDFFSDQLFGRCPRAIAQNKLYLTLDGDRQVLTGVAGATSVRDILILDLITFGPFAFSSVQIAAVADEVWAMSVDPTNSNQAYITTMKGALHVFNLTTATVIASYPGMWNVTGGEFEHLVNTHVYNNKIYASSDGAGTYVIDLNEISNPGYLATKFDPLLTTFIPGGAGNVNHYNVLAQSGMPYVLVTYNSGNNPGGVAKYTHAGVFIEVLEFDFGESYNLLGFDNVPNPLPNGLCPL